MYGNDTDSVVWRHTAYIMTLSFEWWIINWNLLRIPANQISTHSHCNGSYFCVDILLILYFVDFIIFVQQMHNTFVNNVAVL